MAPTRIRRNMTRDSRESVLLHSNNFDGLRLLGAVSVLISHQFFLVQHWEPRILSQMSLGTLAVLCFFSISGFLVAKSWDNDPHLGRFIARRLLRIWPAQAAVVIATVMLVLWFANSSYAPPTAALSLHKTLLPTAAEVYLRNNLVFMNFEWNFFPESFDPRLNGPLWTIGYELACYALLALAACVLKRKWALHCSLIAFPLYVWLKWGAHMVEPGNGTSTDAMVVFAPFFLCGALIHGEKALQSLNVGIAIVGAGIGLILLGSEVLGLLLAVPFVCVLIGLRSWPLLRSAGIYGDLSYGMYLWAWPIQQIGIFWLGRATPFSTLLVVSLVTTAFMALMSWHLLEKQFLRFKSRETIANAYS